MDRIAEIINVIHVGCLMLLTAAYLVGGRLLINQFMGLLK